MGQPKLRQEPTPMGERILAFMSANYVTDMEEFAEGLLGIAADELYAWIYDDVEPETLPVRPMLLCAEALGTNAEYLICASDDPRPGHLLTYDENVILQAYRDADDEGRQQLVRDAIEVARTAAPSSASPYPTVPVRRGPPPANEIG